VLEKLGLRSITIRQFARVNFTHTILSKRKLQFFVDQGFVTGWDDPALPTVRGILARGLSPQALREFILSLVSSFVCLLFLLSSCQGASVSRTNMSMSKLWAANKKLLDPVAPRYVAISSDCFAVEIVGAPEETRARSLHPKNAAVGSKQVVFSAKCLVESADAHLLAVGEEFTFLDWGNAVVEALDKDKKFMRVRLHLAGDVKTTKRKVSWGEKIDLSVCFSSD
jgi:glutamyl-tRNA synthetase